MPSRSHRRGLGERHRHESPSAREATDRAGCGESDGREHRPRHIFKPRWSAQQYRLPIKRLPMVMPSPHTVL